MQREKTKVLIIEDSRPTFDLYEKIFKTDATTVYEVVWADSLTKALEVGVNDVFDIILLDLSLPDSSGWDTFTKIKELAKNTPIIILTGSEDEALAIRALKEGAQDHIAKGQFECRAFLRAVNYSIERNQIQSILRSAKSDLDKKVKERTAALQAGQERMHRVLVGTIGGLASALEMRDPYTAGHQRRVGQLSAAIAKHLGLLEEQTEGLYLASLVHDIGKIGVPLEILVKPTPLNESERALIHGHSEIGYGILKNIEFDWPIARIVLEHHERLDGSGYPKGLSGDNILLESKILVVADVFEAMSSHRPYRSACGVDRTLKELSTNKGILYEANAVDACFELITNKGFTFE